MIPRFYLIVGDAERVKALAAHGPRLIQLRYKGPDPAPQIAHALAACRTYGVQLVINDHWAEAVAAGADFVHLGQEDLDGADIPALRRAGCRIGISTHDRTELDRALSLSPDYVALGPIWETRLKKMKWRPQGLTKLSHWKARTGAIPLVAIGGITPQRAPQALAAGADSVAVVTDIQLADDPVARIGDWLAVTG